jgi:hypothetical protein
MSFVPRVHWSAIMVRQSDGTLLLFHLDHRNRLVERMPRQAPRTEFFRHHRAGLEGPVRPRNNETLGFQARLMRPSLPAEGVSEQLPVDATIPARNIDIDCTSKSEELVLDSCPMLMDWCFTE